MTLSRDPIPPKKGPRPTLGCGPFPFPPILCALSTPLRTASGPPLSAGGRSLPGILSPGPICLSIIDNSRPPLCRTAIEGPANSVVFRRKTGRTPAFSSEPPHSPHPEAKYQHFLPPSKHSLICQKICEPDRLFARNRQKPPSLFPDFAEHCQLFNFTKTRFTFCEEFHYLSCELSVNILSRQIVLPQCISERDTHLKTGGSFYV